MLNFGDMGIKISNTSFKFIARPCSGVAFELGERKPEAAAGMGVSKRGGRCSAAALAVLSCPGRNFRVCVCTQMSMFMNALLVFSF